MIDIKALKDHYNDIKDSKGAEMVKTKEKAQAYFDGWVDGSSIILDLIKMYDVPTETESEATQND